MENTIPAELTCVECGKIESLKNWDSKEAEKLRKMNVCFSCSYWLERIENVNDFVIASGNCFVIDKREDLPNKHKGHGGSEFTFEIISTGKIITSTNVWGNGEIPDRFRERLPDNAKLIN